jgi:hypothetical protein
MPRPRPTTSKTCPKCKVSVPVGCFYASPKYDGGYSPYCIRCTADANRENRCPERDKRNKRSDYAKDPEKFRARSRENIRKLRESDPARYRAKKFFDVERDAVSTDVDRDFIANLYRNAESCECCGKTLELSYSSRDSRAYRSNPNAPSIDRVDNRRGYSKDNMAVICWECNFRKTDLTEDDLEMMLRYIRRFKNV